MLQGPGAQVWDLGRGFCTSTLICHSSVNSVRLTMDGFAAVSGHFDGALRFWDLRSGKLANEVAGLHTQQITSVSIGLRTGGDPIHAAMPLSESQEAMCFGLLPCAFVASSW